MKKYISMVLIIACAFTVVLSGCAGSRQTEKAGSSASGQNPSADGSSSDTGATEEPRSAENDTAGQNDREEENMDRKMIVEAGGSRFTATLEKNKAADTLMEMMQENPITIQMSDYSGFEKVGSLGTGLPTSDRQTTTQSGDIVLYQGNQIVIFYGSNSWSYTRLGRIDDLAGWKEALGHGDVEVTFSLEK